jgi:ribosome maturation factor RimP
MEKVKNDIKTIVEDLKYYLYDVTYEKEGNDYVLRVMIENDSYIDIDDCVKVSKHVSDWLDETNPIEEAYMLEVTSSGAERELRNSDEIKRALGKTVYVETMEQKLEGTLEKFQDDVLTIKHKNKKISKVNYMDVSFIRLAVLL